MSTLTFETRQKLRQEIDRITRLRIESTQSELLPPKICSGCGGSRNNWTYGCRTCYYRWNGRYTRSTDEQFRQRYLMHLEIHKTQVAFETGNKLREMWRSGKVWHGKATASK